ncbi:Hsp70 nucleotide exchange factor FES1 [Cladobotryum mycophilum]|uniref:Hsp70 nucleotide exchange factor FES1 n=1 Tax=Cladobotryum mycophilum TaxID=491253 RepID=A0ABR0SNM3_9HYPO
MGDKRLNELLRWGIENTDTSKIDPSTPPPAPPTSNLTPEIMAALMEVDLENKLIAFDNFEQLIENLDNANNIANLGLWTPLLGQLKNEERELRKMAAWCVGTAVQNNERTQERLLAMGGLPPLVELALNEEEKEDVRRKAIYALSSAVRNYQPSMDLFAEELTKKGYATATVDAADMAQVDVIITALREKAKATA